MEKPASVKVPKVLPKVMSEWKGLRREPESHVLSPAFVDGIFWGGFLYFFFNIIKAFGSNINVFALGC